MRESATRPANMNSYLKKSRLCMTLVIEVMNVGSSVQPDSLLKVVSISSLDNQYETVRPMR
jgi:hypothetical protein